MRVKNFAGFMKSRSVNENTGEYGLPDAYEMTMNPSEDSYGANPEETEEEPVEGEEEEKEEEEVTLEDLKAMIEDLTERLEKLEGGEEEPAEGEEEPAEGAPAEEAPAK